MVEGFVYSLALEDGCFYCGWSADPSCRIAQHFLGRGALWTMLHKPVRVLSVLPGTKELEKVTTIALMVQHTWQRVRGGPWLSIDMACKPPPMAKAFHIKPHLPLPGDCEEMMGHLDKFTQNGGLFLAQISGPKTCEECWGAKRICAISKKSLRVEVERWLAEEELVPGLEPACDVVGDSQ